MSPLVLLGVAAGAYYWYTHRLPEGVEVVEGQGPLAGVRLQMFTVDMSQRIMLALNGASLEAVPQKGPSKVLLFNVVKLDPGGVSAQGAVPVAALAGMFTLISYDFLAQLAAPDETAPQMIIAPAIEAGILASAGVGSKFAVLENNR